MYFHEYITQKRRDKKYTLRHLLLDILNIDSDRGCRIFYGTCVPTTYETQCILHAIDGEWNDAIVIDPKRLQSEKIMHVTVDVIGKIKQQYSVEREIEYPEIGEIECPECGGTIHYRVSSYNGHTLGRCETRNCVSWIE